MELLRNVTIILKKKVIFVLACTVKAEKKTPNQGRKRKQTYRVSFLVVIGSVLVTEFSCTDTIPSEHTHTNKLQAILSHAAPLDNYPPQELIHRDTAWMYSHWGTAPGRADGSMWTCVFLCVCDLIRKNIRENWLLKDRCHGVRSPNYTRSTTVIRSCQ